MPGDWVPELLVSTVTYAPNLDLLRRGLASLQGSIAKATEGGFINRAKLLLVDHGPGKDWRDPLSTILKAEWADEWEILSPGTNSGFGAGHNLAVAHTEASYCLILNPDVVVEENAVTVAIRYLKEHPEVGLITPRAFWPTGERQYLCKQYPSLLDLFLRGLAPPVVQGWFTERLARYEMRGLTESHGVEDIPLASGCFMFLRRQAFDAVQGFSPQFFLYFEDLDLSIRLRKAGWQIHYVPEVVITHYGGHAARKGLHHVRLFLVSAVTFFNQHGWKVF